MRFDIICNEFKQLLLLCLFFNRFFKSCFNKLSHPPLQKLFYRYAVQGKNLLNDELFLNMDTTLLGWAFPKGQVSAIVKRLKDACKPLLSVDTGLVHAYALLCTLIS